MNLFASIFGKREAAPLPHVIIRHVVATKSESAKAKAKREEVHAALRRYVTQKQLVAAVEKAVREG